MSVTERRPRLSVSCVTATLSRATVVLDRFSDVADEIICAVDARVDPATFGVLDGHVDRVVRCEFLPGRPVERIYGWLYGLCRGRWALRVDDDEIASSALVDALPDLIRANDVVQYRLPSWWVFPDAAHAIGDYPWSDDWHNRLVRNEPPFVRTPGLMHTTLDPVLPHRCIPAPVYHLANVVQSAELRKEKVKRYEQLRSGHKSGRGAPINDMYLPETVGVTTLWDVPAVDVDAVQRAIDVTSSGELPTAGSRAWRSSQEGVDVTDADEIERTWAARAVPARSCRASWRLFEGVEGLRAGEARQTLVEVRNDGDEVWPWGKHFPEIRLSYRWWDKSGAHLVAEGHRTDLTADVHPGATALQHMLLVAPDEPGEYTLEFNVVLEHVRWFEGALRLRVNVPAG